MKSEPKVVGTVISIVYGHGGKKHLEENVKQKEANVTTWLVHETKN